MLNPTRCPDDPLLPDGTPHAVVGCGSLNTTPPDDEGIRDCRDCGIWFNPDQEAERKA